jgi:DNA-binding PadR family transcriptional regulator
MVKIATSTPKINIPLRWAILLILVNGELSPAQIKEAINIGSRGVIHPCVGTLYPYLSTLVEIGWISQNWPDQEPINLERPRTVYSITSSGLRALQDFEQLQQNLLNWDTLTQQRRAVS